MNAQSPDRRTSLTSISHLHVPVRPSVRCRPTIRRAGTGATPRLAVIGDLTLDIVAVGEGPVDRGTDVAGSVRFRAGGSAANTARAFVRAGGRATFIGAVGGDEWGRRLVRSLSGDRVTVRSVAVVRPTARLVCFVSPDGERSFVTERGAADALRDRDLEESWFRGADALHLPAYSLFAEPLLGAARRGVALARARQALVSVDLASRAPLLALGRREALDRIASVAPDVILGNAAEAGALAAGDGRDLLDLAPVVVVKEGRQGSSVMWRGPQSGGVLQQTIATTPLATTDTTGAGDAFDAGFLYGILTAVGGWRQALSTAAGLRRGAVSGHNAATDLLSKPRPELVER